MEKLQITKGEAFTDGWHVSVEKISKPTKQHSGIKYSEIIATFSDAGTQEGDSNTALYVDAHNTYLSNPNLPSELLRQNKEMREALAEAESAIKWYMDNTNPDHEDWQTFHDLGMNARANAVNLLTSLDKGKE